MRFSAVIRREGPLYGAWCPELDVASQGANREEALANLKEAVELYLEDEDAVLPEEAASWATFEVGDGKVPGSVGS